ncbi:MAG TPA: hypothetical protein VKU01_25585 [Bryobacteraceae bacterium]|nr:hypothetical protein [Bryobacteraceae bacterium]
MVAPLKRMLAGGDRRSIGNADQVAALVLRRPTRFAELIESLSDEDPIVRMRAADAAEKVSVKRPSLLEPFKGELLRLLEECTQAEVRWHIAVMVPRLRIDEEERSRAINRLSQWFNDRSSLVKTAAIQGLAELSRGNPAMESDMIDLLERASRTGTPAMRARSRILLAEFRSQGRTVR